MTPAIIGISTGIIIILLSVLLRQLNKGLFYGLILSAIGFLYVGFTWSHNTSLIITCIQAIFFLFLAYYGIKKNLIIIAAGYFLHGLWDLAYGLFRLPDLIPPHYDLFCMSIDFVIGAYLLYVHFRLSKISNELKQVTVSN